MYQAKSILKKNFVKRTGKRKQAQLILRENKNLLISTHINTQLRTLAYDQLCYQTIFSIFYKRLGGGP